MVVICICRWFWVVKGTSLRIVCPSASNCQKPPTPHHHRPKINQPMRESGARRIMIKSVTSVRCVRNTRRNCIVCQLDTRHIQSSARATRIIRMCCVCVSALSDDDLDGCTSLVVLRVGQEGVCGGQTGLIACDCEWQVGVCAKRFPVRGIEGVACHQFCKR